VTAPPRASYWGIKSGVIGLGGRPFTLCTASLCAWVAVGMWKAKTWSIMCSGFAYNLNFRRGSLALG
jgi:hypothetical protein